MAGGAFDLDGFRREVREAARKAFAAIRDAHHGERLYAFALYSDDGAMTVLPAANTEEGLLHRAREYGYTAADRRESLRWLTGEWAHEGERAEDFDRCCALLAEEGLSPEDEDDEEGEGFDDHRARVFGAIVDALAELESEGVFGRGPDREALTVLFTVSDSDDALDWARESVRRLNPEAVAARFPAG